MRAFGTDLGSSQKVKRSERSPSEEREAGLCAREASAGAVPRLAIDTLQGVGQHASRSKTQDVPRESEKTQSPGFERTDSGASGKETADPSPRSVDSAESCSVDDSAGAFTERREEGFPEQARRHGGGVEGEGCGEPAGVSRKPSTDRVEVSREAPSSLEVACGHVRIAAEEDNAMQLGNPSAGSAAGAKRGACVSGPVPGLVPRPPRLSLPASPAGPGDAEISEGGLTRRRAEEERRRMEALLSSTSEVMSRRLEVLKESMETKEAIIDQLLSRCRRQEEDLASTRALFASVAAENAKLRKELESQKQHMEKKEADLSARVARSHRQVSPFQSRPEETGEELGQRMRQADPENARDPSRGRAGNDRRAKGNRERRRGCGESMRRQLSDELEPDAEAERDDHCASSAFRLDSLPPGSEEEGEEHTQGLEKQADVRNLLPSQTERRRSPQREWWGIDEEEDGREVKSKEAKRAGRTRKDRLPAIRKYDSFRMQCSSSGSLEAPESAGASSESQGASRVSSLTRRPSRSRTAGASSASDPDSQDNGTSDVSSSVRKPSAYAAFRRWQKSGREEARRKRRRARTAFRREGSDGCASRAQTREKSLSGSKRETEEWLFSWLLQQYRRNRSTPSEPLSSAGSRHESRENEERDETKSNREAGSQRFEGENPGDTRLKAAHLLCPNVWWWCSPAALHNQA